MTTSTKSVLTIGARVLGIDGPGTITEHTVMFGSPASWVDFDRRNDITACPANGLKPLANYADMSGEACTFDADQGLWVRL